MTMAPRREDDDAPPILARERAIPFGPMAETEIMAVSDPSKAQQTPGSRASRSEHRAAVARLARSRPPGRAAKSP